MFQLKFNKPAASFLKKIKDKNLKDKYEEAFKKIAEDPYIGTPKKNDLSGIYGYDIFYRRTNYEIAYRIYEENEKFVVVILAGTRENFYEQLKRYL